MFSDKFNAVMITVYQREGGECNLVGDSGGWTFRGIAQNYWGTKYKNIFDRLKVCKDSKINPSKDSVLQTLCNNFYYNEFWTKVQGDKLPESIAILVMNDAVNAGISGAVKRLQNALGLKENGIIDNTLITTINSLT